MKQILYKRILSMRTQLAGVAQEVYDDWQQDIDGFCEDHGYGGICDVIADAIGGWIASAIENIEIAEGGQDGDDHAFVVVLSAKEAVLVDIPPSVYETGGGYCWRKKPGVVFDADDIVVLQLERKLF